MKNINLYVQHRSIEEKQFRDKEKSSYNKQKTIIFDYLETEFWRGKAYFKWLCHKLLSVKKRIKDEKK